MKNITRVLALLLALILILGLVVTGFADDGGTTAAFGGTITVSNTVDGQDYTLYKILDLESYNETANAYSYKPATGWVNFFNSTDIKDKYVEINELGYVTWKKNADGSDVAGVETFAKLAQKYTVDHATDVASTKKTPNTTAGTVEFENLELGYYLLDSSLGTLCSLDTTNSEVTIKEKNDVPANEKKVQEDSKENEQDGGWTNTNDADIGQTVNFKSTITAQPGAQNYVFHDAMSAGLTFNGTVTVTLNNTKVEANNYTLKTKSDGTTTFTDDCTFEIEFNQDFCNTLKKDDIIVITYSATLNEKAVIAGAGNTNKSQLSYGENSQFKTTESPTTTKTWEVKVFKFHTSATDGNGLDGAKFTLSKNTDGTNPIKLIKLTDATKPNTYRVAMPKAENQFEDGASAEITTDATGRFTIQGLDSDTYYLTEKEAPKGYNKLKDPIAITIDNAGNVKLGQTTVENGEVKVENKTGAELPSTGGIGTTVFYVVGGILAVCAAVLLVTKKRMERG